MWLYKRNDSHSLQFCEDRVLNFECRDVDDGEVNWILLFDVLSDFCN